MKIDKKAFRQHALNMMKQMPQQKKQRIEQMIYKRLFQLNIWKEARVIGITISKEYEWNTRAVIQKAWQQDKTVAIPKTDPKRKKMTFYKFISKDTLEYGYANILEPLSNRQNIIDSSYLDVLFVPGLLFDRKGYRIGFGGGYFDRFLNHFHGESLSFISEQQLIDYIPREPFDIKVKHILTEKNYYQT